MLALTAHAVMLDMVSYMQCAVLPGCGSIMNCLPDVHIAACLGGSAHFHQSWLLLRPSQLPLQQHALPACRRQPTGLMTSLKLSASCPHQCMLEGGLPLLPPDWPGPQCSQLSRTARQPATAMLQPRAGCVCWLSPQRRASCGCGGACCPQRTAQRLTLPRQPLTW